MDRNIDIYLITKSTRSNLELSYNIKTIVLDWNKLGDTNDDNAMLLYLGFRKFHGKITFFVNGKIDIKYKVLNGQERTGIKIMPLELKFDWYFFMFLKHDRDIESFCFNRRKKNMENKIKN